MGREGQQQWRSFLQEHPVSTVLATAQGLFAGVSKRTSPFFGTFQIEHLKPLTVDEAARLLRNIARVRQAEAQENGDSEAERTAAELAAFLSTADGRARVRALHHLSGGNHRVYIVLAEFATRETLDELISPFERMLDELTPYYQERLRWLSAQQRRIVEHLCTCERPAPVKEIARRLFITDQTAAGQLKTLRQLGYVTSNPRGRESLYELTEPLMRLSFELKENRRGPIRLIVDFLRVWYRADELTEQLGRLPVSASRARMHVVAALEAATSSEDPRLRPILAAIEEAESAGRVEEAIAAREELAHTRGTAADWFELGYWLVQVQRFEETLESFDKVVELDPDDPSAWNNRGAILEILDRVGESLVSYDKALELDPDSAFAWNNRGHALRHLGRFEEALLSWDKALEFEPDDAWAWNNRGHALQDLGRFDESCASCDKALGLDPDFALAWNGRGAALHALGRFNEALASWDKALAIDSDYADAWNNRATALHSLGRFEESLESFDRSREVDSDCAAPTFNRMGPLFELGRWNEGFAALERAFETHWPNQWQFAGDVESMIGTIAASGTKPEVWQERAGRLTEIYASAGQAEMVGDGLVRSLSNLDAKMLSGEGLVGWGEVWREAGARIPALQVPLRIFEVGLRYLAGQDRRVLLDLIETERRILEQALGLNSPESAQDSLHELRSLAVSDGDVLGSQ